MSLEWKGVEEEARRWLRNPKSISSRTEPLEALLERAIAFGLWGSRRVSDETSEETTEERILRRLVEAGYVTAHNTREMVIARVMAEEFERRGGSDEP